MILKRLCFSSISLIGKILAKIKRNKTSIIIKVPCFGNPVVVSTISKYDGTWNSTRITGSTPKTAYQKLPLPGTGIERNILYERNCNSWQHVCQVCSNGRIVIRRQRCHHGIMKTRFRIKGQYRDGWSIAQDGDITANIQL